MKQLNAVLRPFSQFLERLEPKLGTLAYDQGYARSWDAAVTVGSFLAFLFPIGAYFVFDKTAAERALATVSHVIVGIIIGAIIGYASHIFTLVGRRKDVPTSTDQNPYEAGGLGLLLVAWITTMAAVVLLNLALGLPGSAWFLVFAFVITGSGLAAAGSLYRSSYLGLSQLVGKRALSSRGIEQRLHALRTHINVWGVLGASLIVTPTLNVDKWVTILGKGARVEDPKAVLWVYSGLAVLVILVGLLVARALDQHRLLEGKLDSLEHAS